MGPSVNVHHLVFKAWRIDQHSRDMREVFVWVLGTQTAVAIFPALVATFQTAFAPNIC